MRKSLIIGGSAFLAAVTIPAIAIAVGPMGMGPDATLKRADIEAMVKDRFAAADLNQDGALTLEEIRQGMDQRRAAHVAREFDAMDTDKNGSISRTEFDAFHQARGDHGPVMMDGHPGMMAPGMGPMPDGPMGPGPMGSMGPGSMKPDHMDHPRMSGMPGFMGERMFTRADANKDGKVTLAEATAAALAHFDKVDANKDKTITPEERRAYHEAKRAVRTAK